MSASHQPALSSADVPGPLRQPLEGTLGAEEMIERAVYSPAFKTSRFHFPASVVALTADRWLMAWEDEGAVEVEADHIEDLLSLELTCILLYGQAQSRLGHVEDSIVNHLYAYQSIWHEQREYVLTPRLYIYQMYVI
jgi:hypothetical protein